MKMLFKNAKIYTVEGKDWDENPYNSMLIRDGKILEVGNNLEAGDAEKFDLKGKIIFPGFIDSHCHFPGDSAVNLYQIYLYNARTRDKTIEVIKEYIKNHPDENAYFGDGFYMSIEKEKPISKYDLDEICSDKPIVLKSDDGHTAWLNSKALEICGIESSDGLIKEDFTKLTLKPEYTEKQKEEIIKDFQKKMIGWGYTSVMLIAPELSLSKEELLKAEKEGIWKLGANLSEKIFETDDEDEIFEKALSYRSELKGNKNLKFNTIKLFADGVVEGGTAFLLEPYEEGTASTEKNFRGEFLWKDEKRFEKILERILNEDFQVHVHTIGDAATKKLLDLMEEASLNTGKSFNRPVLAHLQLIENSDIKRMEKLGIIACHQPFWHFKEPYYYEGADKYYLGEERGFNAYPVKRCKDAGLKLTFAGDFPVSHINNPFYAIETAVTRNLNCPSHYNFTCDIKNIDDPKYMRNPEERIDVKTAVEAYTINGAEELFREEETGSLESGKNADFIVIDKDPFVICPLEIDSIKVLEVYKDGEKIL